ncbi:FAD-dependent oxidoreductase [Rhizobium rhizogenes]
MLCEQNLIRSTFPAYADDISAILHVRRAGSISGQQLGQFMLEYIKDQGGRLLRGEVVSIASASPFLLSVKTSDGVASLRADRIVNAAGPFLKDVAALLGEEPAVSLCLPAKDRLRGQGGRGPAQPAVHDRSRRSETCLERGGASLAR